MVKENDELLKLTSYVQISKYREKTLKSIGDDVKIPTKITKDSGIRTNHISKVLSELKSKDIVECINEEARKGRLYRLTDTGKDVLESIKDNNQFNSIPSLILSNSFRASIFETSLKTSPNIFNNILFLKFKG